MKTLCAVMLAASLAGVAAAQTLTFQDVLSGKTVPLTVKLGSLDDTWRRLNPGSGAETVNPLTLIYGGRFGGALTPNVAYTKGQTLALGGENYLVAYTAPAKALDMNKLLAFA